MFIRRGGADGSQDEGPGQAVDGEVKFEFVVVGGGGGGGGYATSQGREHVREQPAQVLDVARSQLHSTRPDEVQHPQGCHRRTARQTTYGHSFAPLVIPLATT